MFLQALYFSLLLKRQLWSRILTKGTQQNSAFGGTDRVAGLARLSKQSALNTIKCILYMRSICDKCRHDFVIRVNESIQIWLLLYVKCFLTTANLAIFNASQKVVAHEFPLAKCTRF